MSEGRQRCQRVDSDVRGSTVTSEGRQRRQRDGSDVIWRQWTQDSGKVQEFIQENGILILINVCKPNVNWINSYKVTLGFL